ncbi:META domain-containing protein [Marinobacterium marinum]|uniref:META domain-containing protein n=1 Tax=Marinobacterium marinum TaxID=2756129 RepID=A0A7W1WZR1_9GAMM|nr:META domain-containing protein [Marinobacterium marinum]MBA4503191.1 META domain-containing protein [Marinobacterium marinum]
MLTARPRLHYVTSIFAATALLGGCSTLSSPQPDLEVSGDALYRERMLLPSNSRLEVSLQDVSRADAPAILLDKIVRDDIATPPYPFSFKVPASKLQPGHTYTVSARITHDDSLMFITDTQYRVLAGEKDTDLMLIMVRVNDRAAAPQMDDSAKAPLQNTYWKLTSLNGTAIEATKGQREAHLILKQDNRVQGFAGCNQFMGEFKQEGKQLSFGPIAGTLRACIPGLEYERSFLQLLQNQVNWSIDGEQLKLSNPEQNIQATFKAVYLK